MKKFNSFIIMFGFLTLVIVFFLLIGTADGGIFSEEENRTLAKRVKMPVGRDSFSVFNEFCTDNIPKRKELLNVMALSEIVQGKKQSNGTIVYNGYYMKRTVMADEKSENSEKSIVRINELKTILNSQGYEFYEFIIPSADRVKQKTVPYIISTESSFTDIKLSPDDFYKTDHHLKYEGSRKIYSQICDVLGIKERAFTKKLLCNDFIGRTFYSTALPITARESIFIPETENISVEINGKSRGGYIDVSKLEGKDQYSALLGGNHAIVEINKEKALPEILIIKDSYANSICQFLTEDFRITMIDPRYATESLKKYINEYSPKTVILLCNEDFLADSSLTRLLSYG